VNHGTAPRSTRSPWFGDGASRTLPWREHCAPCPLSESDAQTEAPAEETPPRSRDFPALREHRESPSAWRTVQNDRRPADDVLQPRRQGLGFQPAPCHLPAAAAVVGNSRTDQRAASGRGPPADALGRRQSVRPDTHGSRDAARAGTSDGWRARWNRTWPRPTRFPGARPERKPAALPMRERGRIGYSMRRGPVR
jgi:hypothetical protein